MRRIVIVFTALMASLLVVPVWAKNGGTSAEQQRQQADNMLKMLMHGRGVSGHALQTAGGSARPASDGVGAVSGHVYGLETWEYNIAWVEAFSVAIDSLTPDGSNFSKGISGIDSEGRYRIEALPAGDYYVIAFAEGYELLYYKDVVDIPSATVVSVLADRTTDGIDFRMQRISPGTASISGKVTDADDAAPIANAFVSAYSWEKGYWYSAVSDDAGGYSLTGLKDGNYLLQIWADGYLVQYYDRKGNFAEADRVAVTDSAAVLGIDFQLERAGSISGSVKNLQGQPIEGAYLFALPLAEMKGEPQDDDNRYGKAVTDQNGRYLITGLKSDNYAVQLELWTPWSHTYLCYNQKTNPTEADPVPVTTGRETTGIDFTVDFIMPKAVLTGSVIDASGAPIENAYIGVMSVDADRWAYGYATSDRNGYYRISELPDRRYYVSAGVQSGPQYVSRWWPDAESLENAQAVYISESAPAVADFTLPIDIGKSSIAGRITDIDGKPLPWATITVSPAEPDNDAGSMVSSIWAWGYADEMGNYLVSQLPAGEYKVYAAYWEEMNFGEQWWDQKHSQEGADVIKLGDDEQRFGVDLTLNVRPVYGAITGFVYDEQSGAPMVRALVEISPNYESGWNNFRRFSWRRMAAVTDENGFFAVDWLYEGSYLVSVYADGAFEYFEKAPVVELATPVKVIGGQKSSIEFTLTKKQDGRGEIGGRVLIEGSQTPFEIAVVTAKPSVTVMSWPQSELFYTAVTDTLGNFTLRGLPTNVEFYIYAFSTWTVGEYYDNVYDPDEALLVSADGVMPTVLNDIELPVYRWLWNGPEDDQKGGVTNAQIVGMVKDSDGEGIAGARVIVYNESAQPIADTRTTVGGYYEINGLPPGNYLLQVSREGYRTVFNGNAASISTAQPINLGAGILKVDFVLSIKTGIDGSENPSALLKTMRLLGNYPNPFNLQTRIVFQLPKTQQVQLAIYNLAGERVSTLASGTMEAGQHERVWNGRNEKGQTVSSGIYLARLQSGGEQLTMKMILMK